MKTNQAGIDLIKKFEGLRLTAYPDPATGGEPWTIGYGHTSRAGEPKVAKGMQITSLYAEEILKKDLGKFEKPVQDALKRPATGNQFGAMVSLCYNIGEGNFLSSSVLRKFNAGDIAGAADAFRMWNKANGKVMQGLVNRREAERALFLKADADVAPEPPKAAGVPVLEPFEPAAKTTSLQMVMGFIAAALAALVAMIVAHMK